MNGVLWIVQIVLGLMFLLAGLMKVSQPKEKLTVRMGWVNDFPVSIVKTIGSLEILGAIGLVLPALFNILPVLTPLAAGGLVCVMLGAAATHFRRKEYPMIVGNLVLLVLAVLVLYGRFAIVPFQG